MNTKIAALIACLALVACAFLYHNQTTTNTPAITGAVIGGALADWETKLGPATPMTNGLHYIWHPCGRQSTGVSQTWDATVEAGRVAGITYSTCAGGTPAAVRDVLPSDIAHYIATGHITTVHSAMLANLESRTTFQWCGFTAPQSGQLTVTITADGWMANIGNPC